MKRPGGFDSGAEERAKRPARRPAPRETTREAPRSTEPAQRPPIEQSGAAERSSAAEQNGAAAVSSSAPADAVSRDLAEDARGGLLRRSRSSGEPDRVKAAERRLRQAERGARRRHRRETRRFTAATRRTRRRVLIAVSSVLALVLFVMVGAFTPVMAVREVRIEGVESVNADDVAAALERFEGTPLALVDEDQVLHALESFPLIQRFALERIPPSTLLVRIEERVPVVALSDEGAVRLYDAAGVLVGQPEAVPEGVPAGGKGVLNPASDAFREAAKVIRDMPQELRATVASVDAVTGQDVTLVLANGVEVFWGNADETKRKSLVLQTMLASLEGRPVEHIDVSSVEAPVFR